MLIFIYGIITICIGQVQSQGGSISFTSTSLLCIGDPFEMVCFVESSGVSFLLMTALVSFNSSTPFSMDQLNSDSSIDGIDLSRYSANIDGLSVSLSRPGIKVIIHSYQPSDSATTFGCHGISSSGTTAALESGKPNLTAAPPSAPSLQSSVSNFNTATCSADISLSWNTPPSNRNVDRYFLYLDGSPLATTNSNSYIHSTILNINTNYQYSVTAMNCAGNSTTSSVNVNSVKSYTLMRSSQTVCLAYDNVTGGLTVNWELSTPTQPSGVSGLDITYSLQLLYSHSRQGVTYTYTDSTSFTLPSSQLSYNTVLTAHNFTQLDGVETNIAANLMIVQQCGQSCNGIALECFYNSINPPISPSLTLTPISTVSNTPTHNLTDTTTTILPTALPYTNSFPSCLPISITIALILFISLVINLLLITVVIFLLRKITHLNSALTPSKPAPSHPYEYIDLDKMSGNISSPTQQQSPQDYVHMSSTHKQDSIQPPTHYANLK